MGIAQDLNSKIDDWFNYDWDAATKVVRLLVLFWERADGETLTIPFQILKVIAMDKLSLEIYERDISYFKGNKS